MRGDISCPAQIQAEVLASRSSVEERLIAMLNFLKAKKPLLLKKYTYWIENSQLCEIYFDHKGERPSI